MYYKIRTISDKIFLIASRYPLVLAFSLTSALTAATLIHHDGHELFSLIKFLLVSLLGISLSFGLQMASQRYGKELLLNSAGLLVLAAVYFSLPGRQEDFSEVYAFLLAPLFILSHLFVSFAPFLKNRDETRFWHYNKNLLINVVIAAVFTGVLTLGIVLALLAANNLFDLNFRDNIFGQSVVFTAILGSTFSFLLFCDKGLPELESKTEYPAVLKFFTQFILIPLLIIYLAILYLYAGKILVQKELPRGWVSYLILAYSIVGILATLLVHPLKNDTRKSWVRLFSRIFFYTLLPLLVLLFTAIFTRILEYGYTEARYYVLLLALWLTSITGYFLLFPRAHIRAIPVSLFTFGLFGLLFPYLNAFSVAERSQKNELQKLLVEKNMLENGKLDFERKMEYKSFAEVADKVAFLSDRNALDVLSGYLSVEEHKNLQSARARSPQDAKSAFQNFFKIVNYTEIAATNTLRLIHGPEAIATGDFRYVLPVLNAGETSWDVDGKKISYRYHSFTNKTELTIAVVENGTEKKYELTPYLEALGKKYGNKSGNVKANLSHEFSLAGFRFRVYFNAVHIYRSQKQTNIQPENGIILLKKE